VAVKHHHRSVLQNSASAIMTLASIYNDILNTIHLKHPGMQRHEGEDLLERISPNTPIQAAMLADRLVFYVSEVIIEGIRGSV
jgi:hypothetical protein